MTWHAGTLPATVHRLALHIAIDGPAGAGKSTLGRALADALDCSYVDTGLMYRAVSYLSLIQDVSPSDGTTLSGLAHSLDFGFGPSGQILIGGGIPSEALHSGQVDAIVSRVSGHPDVRAVLVRRQRELSDGRAVVMVGRDIGAVVLPSAQVKIWVTASPEVRAARRMTERLGALTELEVLSRLEKRDALDTENPASPMLRPDGASVIETDRLTPREALDQALAIVVTAAHMDTPRR